MSELVAPETLKESIKNLFVVLREGQIPWDIIRKDLRGLI